MASVYFVFNKKKNSGESAVCSHGLPHRAHLRELQHGSKLAALVSFWVNVFWQIRIDVEKMSQEEFMQEAFSYCFLITLQIYVSGNGNTTWWET